MQPTIFGGFVIAIGIWCQFGPYSRTMVAMLGLVVFGAVAALDLPALGGASVTPANLFLVFYLLRLVSMRGGTGLLIAEVGPRRPLFLFLLLVVWTFGSAVLLPRLFDGTVSVFSLSRSAANDGDLTPLHPTSGNLSQAIYAMGGFLAACATGAYARRPDSAKPILTGIVLVTTLHLGFAMADLITSATHTGFILDVIHTASYAFLTDDELGGLKRISGSFSEASAFAMFSLTLLAVNFTLFVARVRPRFTGIASLLLSGFIVLATSSAGYVGLVVFYAMFLIYAVADAFVLGRKRAVAIAVGLVGAALLLSSIVILFVPSVANVAQTVINDSLLNKATSDSAIERGSWNAQAWQIFKDTHGLGAGIGTTRGSNYALVLLSNLGLIGSLLFVALMVRLTVSRLSPRLTRQDRALVRAARVGMLTALVPNLLIGTVYDLGTLFYCLAGIAAAGAATMPETARATTTGRTIDEVRTVPRVPTAPVTSRDTRRGDLSSLSTHR